MNSLVPSYRTRGGWIATPEFMPDVASTNRFKHEGCPEAWYHDMRDGSVRGVIQLCCGSCNRPYGDHQLVEPVLARVPEEVGNRGKYAGYAELSVLMGLEKLQGHELLEIFYEDEAVSLSESLPNPGYGQPNNVNQHTQTISTYRSVLTRKARYLVGRRAGDVLAGLQAELKLAKNALEHREKSLKDNDEARVKLEANVKAYQAANAELISKVRNEQELRAGQVEKIIQLTGELEALRNFKAKPPAHFRQGLPIIPEPMQVQDPNPDQNRVKQ